MKSRSWSLTVRRTSLALACACAWAPFAAQSAPQAPTAIELMDWAQAALPDLFPGSMPNIADTGFVFRGPYATGNFMGVAGDTVYVLGPPTGGQLLAIGTLADLACTVKPLSCEPVSDAPTLVNAYLARLDAMHVADLTAGAQLVPTLDGCYMHNGYTRAAEVQRFDDDPQVRDFTNRKRGSTRRDSEVLAERHSINPDGSSRREIDVRYERVNADGMVQVILETFVQGSSSGTRWPTGPCATPQVSQELRWLGNQRIVGASVTPRSIVLDRYKLADGTPHNPAQLFRSEIRFNVTDPGNFATYATITGPGIRGTYKLVSPRLLRSAPEFAGKIGNYVDWSDTEPFKACRNPTDANYADAAVADCTANGASSNNWIATNVDPAVVDQVFSGYGFVAAGTYTIQVYSDDGWKTVNGQAGKTPLATYVTRLNRLPASAAALSAGGASAFPTLTLSLTPVQIATIIRTKSAGSLLATATQAAKVDDQTLAWNSLYFFSQGRTAASTNSNFYPASRFNPSVVPPINATSDSVVIPVAPATLVTPTYGEIGLTWEDSNGFSVRRIVTFE